MNSYDRFAELWTDYLEGELSDAQIAELRQLLDEDPQRLSAATASYQLHRLLGLVAKPEDSDGFVAATMQRIPMDSDGFVAGVMNRLASSPLSKPIGQGRAPYRRSKPTWIWWAVSAILLLAISSGVWVIKSNRPSSALEAGLANAQVRFANTARTKFLGEYTPAVGSSAELQREYILTSGSVQLEYPNGAQAIVSGPAIFQVNSVNSLQVSVGKCSVYAPQGAEGFAVETPSARVVDRGTRFAVDVAESSATEVHVVEGAADVYRDVSVEKYSSAVSPVEASDGLRLNGQEARLFHSDRSSPPQPTPFKPRLYQSQLADRIISYDATIADGGANELLEIRVQRDGRGISYKVDELIGVKLKSFCNPEKLPDMRHIACIASLAEDRLEVFSDASLRTGAINPGGAVTPALLDPAWMREATELTQLPGFAVQFDRPVVNAPGPDVVFFELQNLAGAPDGDSFHVMPMKRDVGYRPLTIRSYDLTLTSPEVFKPADFYIYEFDRAVDSIEELSKGQCRVQPTSQGSNGYRILAVGIDLSAMGLEEGEACEALFFQDSLDDVNHVDPVFIAGLPEK